MNATDILLLVAVVAYLVFRFKMNTGSAPKQEEATVEAKDEQLQSQLQPVPPIVPPAPPEATAFTPGQATSYWNKELDK